MWKGHLFFYSQYGGDFTCEDPGDVSGVGILSGKPVSDGSCSSGRILFVSDYLCCNVFLYGEASKQMIISHAKKYTMIEGAFLHGFFKSY